MPETEIAVKAQSTEVAERTLTPGVLKRALDLRAAWAAQDDAALLGALKEGDLDGAERSVRILPTAQRDTDGNPIYITTGPDESPDPVLGGMIGRAFTVHHQPVRGPAGNALPTRQAPALPGSSLSRSSTTEEGEA